MSRKYLNELLLVECIEVQRETNYLFECSPGGEVPHMDFHWKWPKARDWGTRQLVETGTRWGITCRLWANQFFHASPAGPWIYAALESTYGVALSSKSNFLRTLIPNFSDMSNNSGLGQLGMTQSKWYRKFANAISTVDVPNNIPGHCQRPSPERRERKMCALIIYVALLEPLWLKFFGVPIYAILTNHKCINLYIGALGIFISHDFTVLPFGGVAEREDATSRPLW